MDRRSMLAQLVLVAAAASGCAAPSSQTTVAARGPTPPSGSYLPPPVLPPAPVVERDPVVEAAARTRVLAVGDEWPMVIAWDGTPPVDRGDGVLRVRPDERCRYRRPDRWSGACASSSAGWRRGRHRGWRGARAW